MVGPPVTLNELLATKSFAGKAEVIRALDAERASFKAAIDAAQSRADHAVRTLRDQFAQAALSGFCVNYATPEGIMADPDKLPSAYAESAYWFADAMLAAREKGGA